MNRLQKILPLLILVLATYACAKIGSPYGGDKDETPPQVIKAKPAENSVNFVPQKKVTLVFDEYIKLKDIYQELIISPPIEGKISARIKGKALVIEFPVEAVFDSTTYTISFGNSILDNNEGNVLENYQYVFSLKDYIDTMNVEGRIVSAFDHEADDERMLVMLYKNLSDSTPLLEKPDYICRTDKNGNFSINRIETGNYRIFGLKDANLNLLYDLPDEKIAFGDSIIEISSEKFWENVVIRDSLLYDSLMLASANDSIAVDSRQDSLMLTSFNDSLAMDSTASDSIHIEDYYSFNTELFFFVQETYNQYLTNYTRPRPELLSFTFNEAVIDSFELFPLNYSPVSSDWYVLDASLNFDTLDFWIKEKEMFSKDSLKMEFVYPLHDSLGVLYSYRDTLLMLFQEQKASSGRKSRKQLEAEDTEEKEKEPVLSIRNNIGRASAFDMNRGIALMSKTPLSNFIADSILLFRLQDTLEFPVKRVISVDTTSLYRINIDYEPEEETSYRLFVSDSIIYDIFGTSNDTLEYRFKTQSLSAYSSLNIEIKNVDSAIILQLMNSKQDLVSERFISGDGNQRFEFLYPGKYIFKIIVDRNHNGVWDTGDYLQKIQPEEVIYFEETIELRANWEMEFLWEL